MLDIEERWARSNRGTVAMIPSVSADGIMLGAGTFLLRACDSNDVTDDNALRALCLLSIARDRGAAPSMESSLRKAFRCWNDGDKALAQIRLSQSHDCHLASLDEAWRLFLADAVLASGMAPNDLLRKLSLPAVKAYNPAEPRNPEGTGREAGRWTKAPSAFSGSPKLALLPPPAVGLLQGLDPAAVSWLARVAAKFSAPVAFFGALVIPEPNPGVATEGVLPDHPDITYRIDHDTGVLRLASKGDSDPEDAIVALLGHDGLYRQVDSGKLIGRVLPNGAVIIDIDDEQTTNAEAHEEPGGAGRPLPVPPRQPKLCPDPGPDAGRHYGFSAAYELYVRDHVNPQRIPQLPVGLTFALPSDAKRGWTYYDDCQESTGKMIEAKSDKSGFMLGGYGSRKVKERYLEQALSQVRAAQGRPVEWYFHWKKAASLAEALFDSKNIPIRVHYLPYPGRSR